MKKLVSLFIIFAFSFAHADLKSTQLGIYGLERIPFDSWTQGLSIPSQGTLSPDQLSTMLNSQIQNIHNEQELFSFIQKTLPQIKISMAADSMKLAEILLRLRQDIRTRNDLALKNKRDSLFLLQLMAEEALVVGQKRFTDFPKELVLQNEVSTFGSQVKLRDFSVQSGDVVLSKATGTGSSSFIALSMSHPHIFSHSTPVYVDNQNRLLSPESETEDGVKLRDMTADYIQGSKTRTYIYRYQGSNPQVLPKVQSSITQFVQDMYARTDGDPFNKASYKYDYSMTPGNAEQRGLFCSSVSLEIYQRAGFTGNENPYPQSNWSPVTQIRKTLLRTLNMNTVRVPAPGDLELNPDFHMVGMRLDLTKLEQDRIEMAIIDSFMNYLDQNKDKMDELEKNLEKVGNQPIDKEQIKKMAEAGALPPQLGQKLTLLDKIPENINIKQLMVFAFMNEVLTPKIRTQMQTDLQALEKDGHTVGPQELRKMAMTKGLVMANELTKYTDVVKKFSGPGLCSSIF